MPDDKKVSHTHTVSKHGKGMAIDINTLYNPYHKRLKNGKEVIEPATGKPYLDRSQQHPYMIKRGDLCYRLFKQKGFRWGGDWKSMKDYQHFERFSVGCRLSSIIFSGNRNPGNS